METLAKYGWILGLICLGMAAWNASSGRTDTLFIAATIFMFIAGIVNLTIYFFVWLNSI